MKNGFQTFGFGMPWEEAYGFSQALRSGSTLYISGQLSHDMDAKFVGEGDFELQVRTTFTNIDRVLEAHSARKDLSGARTRLQRLTSGFRPQPRTR